MEPLALGSRRSASSARRAYRGAVDTSSVEQVAGGAVGLTEQRQQEVNRLDGRMPGARCPAYGLGQRLLALGGELGGVHIYRCFLVI